MMTAVKDETQIYKAIQTILTNMKEEVLNEELDENGQPVKPMKKKKIHKCDICDKVFACKNNRIIHERSHTGEKPYQCAVCCLKFDRACTLKIHMMIHSGEKPFKCDKCPTTFRTLSNFKTHSRIHTGEKPYKCTKCPAAFARSQILKRHMTRHDHVKLDLLPAQLQVSDEEASIKSSQCATNKQTAKNKESSLKCFVCEKTFKSKTSLSNHFEDVHSGIKPYTCQVCNTTFAEECSLQDHMSIHTEEKESVYKCDNCNEAYSTADELRHHISLCIVFFSVNECNSEMYKTY